MRNSSERGAAATSTPNVVLREVAEADLDVFFDQQLDPEATAMAAFPSRDRTAHMAHWAKILGDEALVARTIDADGQVAGYIGSWVNEHGAREIGYWLGKAYWGRGIATEAVARFVEMLHERPLYAGVAEHNVASMRVLEKCGFVRLPEQPPPRPDEVVRVVEFELRT